MIDGHLSVGTVSSEFNNTVPEGNIISQAPAAGTEVLRDSPVNLVVSLGPDLVTVPDVIGMAQGDAESTLLIPSLEPCHM